MALDDYFIWGNNGARMTPDEIAQQRLLLARKSGIDTSPVASPWQGAARVADAIAGAFERGSLDRASKANDAESTGLRSDLMSGFDGSPPTSASSSGIPMPGAASQMASTAPSPVSTPTFANDGTELGGYLSDPARRATLPAGMRNNNPGNIKFVGQSIPGIVGPSQNTDEGDPQAVFATPEAGMNAMHSLLMKKYAGGKMTPNQMIAGNMGWTPGNFQAAANVASTMGIGPDDDIGFNDPARAARFMQGLILQEHGNAGKMYPLSMIQSSIGGQPVQVASAQPQTASDAIAAYAPGSGSISPAQSAISAQSPLPAAQDSSAPQSASQQPATEAIVSALANRNASPSSAVSAPLVDAVRTAQATPPAGSTGSASSSPSQQAALVKALTSPYVDEGTRRLATLVYQRQQAQSQAVLEYRLKQSDPEHQAAVAKAQYEVQHLGQVSPDTAATLKAQAEKPIEVNGRLVNPQTGAVITDLSNPQVSTVDGSLVNNRTGKPIYQSHTPINVNGHMVDPVSGQQVADYSNPNVSDVDGALVDQRTGKVIYQGIPKGVTVDPGQSLVNPQTGKVLVQGSGMKNDDISGIRKEVQQLPSYKNLAQAAPIYKSMLETFGRNTKASDLNMVYGLGKIMDPTSVVREGEVDMARNTASWPDYLRGALETLKGGAALDPATRSAIMKEAYGRISGYDNEFKQSMTQYQGIAKRYNVNPDDIIPPFEEFQQAPAPGNSSAPAAPAGVPSDVWGIMTPEERKLWQK